MTLQQRLYEQAKRWSVETYEVELVHGVVSKYTRKLDRHDLEIALDLLRKLSDGKAAIELGWNGDDWWWEFSCYPDHAEGNRPTLIEAIVELAERAA